MQKINFENKPSTNSPINATNLNALQDNVEDEFDNKTTEINNLSSKMGNLLDLDTVSKDNLVNAVNEVYNINLETILFEGESNQTNITINENINNFDEYGVFYKINGINFFQKAQVGNSIALFGATSGYYNNFYGIKLVATSASITNTSLNKPIGYNFHFKTDNTIAFNDTDNLVYITKIVGYKNRIGE